MRLLALLHRWTGGIAGLLLAVIGLSGTALLWEDAWILVPGANDAASNDPAALGRAVEVALEQREGLSRITFAGPEIGLHQAAYADGSGAYVTQGGAVAQSWESLWGRPELWLFDLHHYLLLGETGKTITGILGLLLVAFTVTGLILWWRTRRTFRLRLWPARMTASAIVRQHRDLGVVASPLLLLAGLTGSLMVFPALADALLAPLARGEAAVEPPGDLSDVGEETDWVRVMMRAQAAFPDAAPRRLMFPAEPGAPLALRLKQDFEWTPNGRTYVWLDPASARVVEVSDPATGDAASAVSETFYPIHAGKVGGLLWRLLLTFAGFALVVLGTFATWSFWFAGKAKVARPASRPLVAG